MPTLFDRQDANSGTFKVYAENWAFQTFTPAVAFTLYSIDILCFYKGTPGNPTLSLYSSQWGDDNQEPLSSLAAKVETYSDLNENSETWYRFTFETPIVLTLDTIYAIVLNTPSGDSSNYIGWRISDADDPDYGAPRVDIAGFSPDSGSAWEMGVGAGESFDFAFRLYGETIEYPDTAIGLVLAPQGNGTFTELSSHSSAIESSTDYNWQRVADPLGSPDDGQGFVTPAFIDKLTGIVTWVDKEGALDNDLVGVGTAFTSELAEGYFIKRTLGAAAFDGSNTCQVKTITNNENLILEWSFDANKQYGTYGRNKGTWANGHTLTGLVKWVSSAGYVIEGAGGNDFENELKLGDRVRPTGWYKGYYISEILSATSLKIGGPSGERDSESWSYNHSPQTVETEIAPIGEDEDGETLYCPPTKKDSYILKQTMSRGKIHGVKVIYRVRPWCYYLGDQVDWESYDAPDVTATPFLYYNSEELDGTQITLTPSMAAVSSGSSISACDSEWQSRFEYFTTKPGGGKWTWEAINNLQVGIILSMAVEDLTGAIDQVPVSVMQCTQLLVVVYQTPAEVPPPDPDGPPGPTPDPYDPDPEPDPKPEPDPIDPPTICTPGATVCRGPGLFDLFTCNAAGTAWVLTERKSETCGYTPYVPDPEDPDPVKCQVSEYGLLAFDDGLGNLVDEYGNIIVGGVSERGYIQEEFFPV